MKRTKWFIKKRLEWLILLLFVVILGGAIAGYHSKHKPAQHIAPTPKVSMAKHYWNSHSVTPVTSPAVKKSSKSKMIASNSMKKSKRAVAQEYPPGMMPDKSGQPW